MAIANFMRVAALAFAAFSLGGCALANIADGPAPSLYVLTAPAPQMPEGTAPAAQIAVEEFSAPAAIDTARIVFQPSANEIAYYAGARWADRAPKMIAALLVETLDGTGRFPAVVGSGGAARADLMLTGDIRRFSARKSGEGFGAGTTGVEVSLFVRLVRASDRRVVAAREFSASADAGPGIGGVVAAYDAALGAALSEIALWALDASAASYPKTASN